MTKLSVNLNKIALLRNSRGRDFPNVVDFAEKFISRGVHGITVHPRQDERHITRQDVRDLSRLLSCDGEVEFNIEGYPSEDFLQLVEEVKPKQCTLVPDSPEQLTSDHGWDLSQDGEYLATICERLNGQGIRTAIFLDPSLEQVERVKATHAHRIELYTETLAAAYGTPEFDSVLAKFKAVATRAQELGIEVNAGHDLDLQNLPHFLTIPDIKEVSIGHVLMIECIEQGLDSVVEQYLDICRQSA
ncbi:pyridoxine 5'-phosphate synthase [Veronia nyctiphanis]|uniref:Pyridoxine 5'-phosphate synthase n=1 Tax=Veronia nyctiphanis TaxID=1278244 RepID=A0A4Q0YQL2_9GAMM|nr:pyridoxine 5'-phosphate synthase [Veronia nyctiphanis]RXJ72843.1 pyridoxine 5'-phosphate synthase [Veronia nyctiphanis]